MTENPGRERLVEVYMEGLAGITPDVPPRYEDLEEAALAAMSDEAYAYVAGGAGAEETVERNRTSFSNWRIVPRMLRDVETRDLAVEILGRELPVPVLLAPVGVQSIVHDEGELATARGASAAGVPVVASSVSSWTMEEIAEEYGDGPKWFQLYWSAERDITASFVERAETAGYDALVVTVDTPIVGWRERDVEHAYLPFLEGEGVANYFADEHFLDLLDQPPEENELAAIRQFIDAFGDPSLTFDAVEWLRDETDLPVVVKGLLHPDDARAAVDAGAEGVVVSNHGGRQVDGAIGALEALPGVVDEVGDEATVLFDSGIRRGGQAIKALALGAEAVLLGRPYVYGLALEGADGVEAVCRNFVADLDLTLGLSGYDSVADLDRDLLVRSEVL